MHSVIFMPRVKWEFNDIYVHTCDSMILLLLFIFYGES